MGRSLHGKLALITGAASGIGRATALRFAREGARLIVCDLDQEKLRNVAAELGASCVLAHAFDVSQKEAWQTLTNDVHAQFGAVDVLVNNAGVGLSGGILSTPLEDWEWIVSINLWGVIYGCHFLAPDMVERGNGHIVNLSSVLGYVGAPDVLAYATTKFGVLGFSESLAAELAPKGVRVSTICPGVINTNIVKATRYHGVPDPVATRDQVVAMYKKRNYGPERVAQAIANAVLYERSVVPVTPEAWGLYYLKRAVPGLVSRLTRIVASRAVR